MSEDLNNRTDARESGEDNFDTTGLLLDYLAHWKWFAISIVVCLIAAYFYTATIIPTYQVKASIYLKDPDKSSEGAFSLDSKSALFEMKSNLDETELEIIKSRNNVIYVVDSLKMTYSYALKGRLRKQPIYQKTPVIAKMEFAQLDTIKNPIDIRVSQGSSKGLYNIEAKTTINQSEASTEITDTKLPCTFNLGNGDVLLTASDSVAMGAPLYIHIANRNQVAGALSKALNLEFAQKAETVVRITYSTSLPNQGIDVLNTLIDFYNRQIIEDKNLSAMQTEAFIIDRLIMINNELRDVEQRLQEYRQAHNVADLRQQVNANLATSHTVQNQLAEIEAQSSVINEIETTIRNADTFDPLPAASSDNTLNTMIVNYNKQVQRLSRMLETQTMDNPTVAQLVEELKRSKADILRSVETVKRGIQARRNNVAAIEGQSQRQLSAVAPIDKGLQEIFREQEVKVNIYTFLLQKREEIALQKTLATPTARFIDNPESEGPVAPRRLIILLAAFILGAAIPAAYIFLRRYFFPIYKDQDELQRLTNVPILGEIPAANSKESGIVVGPNVSTSSAELFRLLRNNITFTRHGSDSKVILVTSSVSGEGKTFISTNLALTYAITGKKVLVVGLDIRRPALAHKLGISNRQGVTSFLSGQVSDINSLVHKSQYNDNLFILPAGPVPPNPNELLLSDRMNDMMKQIREEFDIVILDTAPIGVISDTLIIIPHSDIQLFVTRASYSTRNSIKVLHQAVRDNRLNNVYIVLNGVNINSGSYTYRRYGHYTHKGSYGYGYTKKEQEQEQEKK